MDYLFKSHDEKTLYETRTKIPTLDLFDQIGRISGEDWNIMPDKSKLFLILDIMDKLRAKKIIILKSPLYYLEELDSFYRDIAHYRFTVINTLYCFAVLNKDWDDGSDKEERIKRLLPQDWWGEFAK